MHASRESVRYWQAPDDEVATTIGQRRHAYCESLGHASRDRGYDDVAEHLRRATKAFLSGDYASARAVFEAILPPIASAHIDLGQHELVEEVLGVDARACVAQYVASVHTPPPLRHRADAMLRALEQVEGVGTLLSPIKDMEDVSAGVASDLTAFLPLWVKRLQRFRPSKHEWETEHERWLREAVFRADASAVSSGSRERRSGLRRASPGMRRSPARVTGHRAQGVRRGGEDCAPVALARRVPRGGRNRRSGAWPVRSVQAAGSRVARRSHDDSVTALARR
jgi:hypothetical protein